MQGSRLITIPFALNEPRNETEEEKNEVNNSYEEFDSFSLLQDDKEVNKILGLMKELQKKQKQVITIPLPK